MQPLLTEPEDAFHIEMKYNNKKGKLIKVRTIDFCFHFQTPPSDTGPGNADFHRHSSIPLFFLSEAGNNKCSISNINIFICECSYSRYRHHKHFFEV